MFPPHFAVAQLAIFGGFGYIESIASQPSGLILLGY
jgi:hypothetical protein